MRTWFITGGTPGGFGMAYADAALARGDRVVLTARRPELLEEWVEAQRGRALALPLDVTDAQQVHRAVTEAHARFGGIDVLVNNAGRGWVGSVEGTRDETARASMELNYFSVLTVLRAVLPGMRRRGAGWVVTMSSAAGLRAVPGFGHYSAAKFAVEGLSEALAVELAPFGIRVLLVEPGAFRTRAYASFAGEPVDEAVDDHASMVQAVRSAMVASDGRQPGDPARGVRAVLDALEREHPPTRLVLGAESHAAVVDHLTAKVREIEADREAAVSADFPSP